LENFDISGGAPLPHTVR